VAFPLRQRAKTAHQTRATMLGLGGTSTYQCWHLHLLWPLKSCVSLDSIWNEINLDLYVKMKS